MYRTLLNGYLKEISAAHTLGITVVSADAATVVLHLPRAGNTNHHHTMFGGSLALAATLCGWCQVALHCPEAAGNIVIKSSHIRYIAPAISDVRVMSASVDANSLNKAQAMLRRFGKASLTVGCNLYAKEVLVAEFEGVFVVTVG